MLLATWLIHVTHTAGAHRNATYTNDVRMLVLLQVKQENPGIAFTEVAKVLGEKWKNVTADEKKQCEEQAAQDKTRYEQQMAAYKATKAEAADSD